MTLEQKLLFKGGSCRRQRAGIFSPHSENRLLKEIFYLTVCRIQGIEDRDPSYFLHLLYSLPVMGQVDPGIFILSGDTEIPYESSGFLMA